MADHSFGETFDAWLKVLFLFFCTFLMNPDFYEFWPKSYSGILYTCEVDYFCPLEPAFG